MGGQPCCFVVVREADTKRALAAADSEGTCCVTVYDTNGSAEPFGVTKLVTDVVAATRASVLFHGHNDLGLAVANAWAAVSAGASVLDVTVNGLGDRAGGALQSTQHGCAPAPGVEDGQSLWPVREAGLT